MNAFRNFFLFLIIATTFSCKPKIYSFNASPRIITESDSVHLHWKICGKPSLTFHEKNIRYFAGDSLKLLQFSLQALKGKSASAPRLLEVKVLPGIYRDFLVFPVTELHEDTLIASGNKDSLYRDFRIESMTLLSTRKLLIEHGVYQTMLYDSSIRSNSFQGLEYIGPWKIQTLLTPEEKQNHKLIPSTLMIAVYIKPKKP